MAAAMSAATTTTGTQVNWAVYAVARLVLRPRGELAVREGRILLLGRL